MPISKSSNKRIGITLGDPSGIGPEVVARALAEPSVRKLGTFTVIGDRATFEKYCSTRYGNCCFIDPQPDNRIPFKPGRPSRASAASALNALHAAVGLIKRQEISCLVTAPVCKEAIHHIDPAFVGHTEFLADAFGVKDFGMMFVSQKLRIIIVTRHIPLNKVSGAIHAGNVYDTIRLTHRSLRNTFKIRNPRIAVCGLNPHAGEGGTIGKEELTKIIPAIQRARRHNMTVRGPFPADTLYSSGTAFAFDAIVAMYHDQGLIPVKTLGLSKLVNLTVGLPFIRTSPAHGTAFDIAGKGRADPSSMREAIRLAARLNP
ncbi:MAG: 4-hydroxythreonine-4-phosphate dehydrogenase PdxA [Omnitrophica WOR_2 bacterium RIFCSPHIGHO2_02_FULL_52_10]|nr:MAG: 4-hydroxythreonine-4-phosphate dehydrogenase PdxA [Omnitrophica WOR_2 bacterium RIFCSPHIGHO2_02_FULL_52_10]